MKEQLIDQIALRAKREEAARLGNSAPHVAPGSTADSLRSIPGFSGITDEMLRARESFSAKDHKNKAVSGTINLKQMTVEQLHVLISAATTELQRRSDAPTST